MIAGLHVEQGFCVRFPAEINGEALETWEDWSEYEFLAADGSIDATIEVDRDALADAREVLEEAEDGTHLHLHESDD